MLITNKGSLKRSEGIRIITYYLVPAGSIIKKKEATYFLIAFSELLGNQTKSHTAIPANVSAELQAYFMLAILLKLTGSNNYLMSQASRSGI